MRILHVITSLRTGGAEKLMVDMLPRMKAEGHEVDLCVFDGIRTPFYEEIEEKGIKVIPLGHSVYSLKYVFKLINIMKHYDVVHAHNTASQYFVAIASCFVSCDIYTTEHNTANRRRNVWWKFLDRWMYGRYKKVVCVSELTKRNLMNHLYNNPIAELKPFIVIYNGIDVSYYEKYESKREDETNLHIIIMVGAFRWEKDQKTLVRALKYLNDNYVVWFVGGGDNLLIMECKALAKQLEVDNRVFMLGIRRDVVALLHHAEIVVQSSHVDGFCLAALEGMASGKPVVVSDIPGMGDIVRGYGVLFPHEDDKSLASEIYRLCEDSDYAKKVAVRCQKRARMFDIHFMVQEYLKLYGDKK